MYEVTYEHGASYTVHLPGRDLIFERKGKLYVADMSDWMQEPGHRANVATVQDREALYSAKEARKASEAR
jgi:hypothetical protein